MKTELIDVSPTRKEIKIEIEPETVRDAYERVSKQYSKSASVPGFRPGHAPTSVVRTRYKSEIRSDVLRELLPDAVHKAIIEHELLSLGEPDVQLDNTEALERFGEEPITLKVAVEVLPNIDLSTYKGLEIIRRKRPITDEDVERMIEGLRDASASLEPVEDRASEVGDTVTINARGAEIDNPEAEEIKVDDIEVVLGGQGVQQEFTDNLLGVKPDDTKTFQVEYPVDFSTPRLAGKKIEYVAEVTAVRRKELPEIDDEWVKSLGGHFESVEALRTTLREDLENRATDESEQSLRLQLVRKLLDAHQFEVPQSLVERQTQQRLSEVAQRMIGQGIDPRNEKLDWMKAREGLAAQAEEDVRATMLIEKVAELENISASEEEIAAEIEVIANAARQPLEQVRAALTKDGGERSIAHRLRNRKALDLLIENARITDGEWIEPKDAEEPATDEPNSPDEPS